MKKGARTTPHPLPIYHGPSDNINGQIMSDMTFSDYQKQVDDWIRTHGVRYFSELTNTAILMEEVGEVARIMARRYGDQSAKTAGAEADLGDELADVLFVVCCLANQAGVDLTQALRRNLDKKTKRDRRRHWDNPKLNRTGGPNRID